MKTSVKRWGHSAAVRIPASILRASRLSLGDKVDVREEAGRIVIEPLRRRRIYDVRQLLKGITSKNQHDPVDFGPAIGKEIW